MPIVHPRRRWCLRLRGDPLTWAHAGYTPGSASGTPWVTTVRPSAEGTTRHPQTVTTPPVMLKVVNGPGPHPGPGMVVFNCTVWSVDGTANDPVFTAVNAGGVSK